MDELKLLEKLEKKYERPKPSPCCVCGSEMAIAHQGGGLPLRWLCSSAQAEKASGRVSEGLESHLSESEVMDYRKVGDGRVMQLVEMYRALRQRTPES